MWRKSTNCFYCNKPVYLRTQSSQHLYNILFRGTGTPLPGTSICIQTFLVALIWIWIRICVNMMGIHHTGHTATVIFLIRYSRGEHKEAMEISVIQQIVQLGIEREELRDEILVQCMRQLNHNPHPEQVK